MRWCYLHAVNGLRNQKTLPADPEKGLGPVNILTPCHPFPHRSMEIDSQVSALCMSQVIKMPYL